MDDERFLKCIGDNNRRRILTSLGEQEICVSDIITDTGMEQTLVSFHLKALRKCGLVTTRRDGKKILYKISNPGILKILNSIQDLVTEIDDACDSDECR